MKKILFFFLCLAPSAAFCGPGITLLSGARTELEINRAVADKARWFDRAILNCASQTKRSCDIVIELQLAPQATTPSCTVASNSMKPEELARLYCKVAETLSFTPLPEASAFTLAFNKKTEMVSAAPAVGVARVPAVVSAKAEPVTPTIPAKDKAAAAQGRDLEAVRTYFDTQMPALGNIYQKALLKDAKLQAHVKLDLTIEKDGSVAKAGISNAAESGNADFQEQLLAAVRSFNFGPATASWQGTHELSFLPSP